MKIVIKHWRKRGASSEKSLPSLFAGGILPAVKIMKPTSRIAIVVLWLCAATAPQAQEPAADVHRRRHRQRT